jgi:hypothetical protein
MAAKSPGRLVLSTRRQHAEDRASIGWVRLAAGRQSVGLTLAELEAPAGLRLAIFFAFHRTRITR